MADEVVKEYQSSLDDLTFNSKPLINMLTMLADDNVQYAAQIVQVIEAHIQKVAAGRKLPALYLVDSIVKNVSNSCYPQLFSNNLPSIFVAVFEKVDEKTRANMYKLRQTWTSIFPNKKLYSLDSGVNRVDPAWPITATPPSDTTTASAGNAHNIHVNPKFIMKQKQEQARQREEDQMAAKMVEALRRQQEAIKARKRKEESSQSLNREDGEELRLQSQREAEEAAFHLKQEKEEKERQDAAAKQQLYQEEQRNKELEQQLLAEQQEAEATIREQLLLKQQELFKLQQQRLELELQQYKQQVEHQQLALQKQQEELKRKEEEMRRKAEEAAKGHRTAGADAVKGSTGTTAASSTVVSTASPSVNKQQAGRTPAQMAPKPTVLKQDPRLARITKRDPRSRGSSPVDSSTGSSALQVEVINLDDSDHLQQPGAASEKASGMQTGTRRLAAKKTVQKTEEKVHESERRDSPGKSLPKSYRDRSPEKGSARGGRSRSGHGSNARTGVRSRNQRSRSPEAKSRGRDLQRQRSPEPKAPRGQNRAKSRSRTRSPELPGKGKVRSPKASGKRHSLKARSPTRSRSRSRSRSPRRSHSPRHDWRKRTYRSRNSNDEEDRREGDPRSSKGRDEYSKEERPRAKARGRRSSSEERETPQAKKAKQADEEATEKKDDNALSNDLVGLFGSEDQDYRRLPPIPKLPRGSRSQSRPSTELSPPVASPRQQGWARFKASRPQEFPFSQPRRASLDSTDFQLLSLLGDGESSPDSVPKPHVLNRAEDILQQADTRLKEGKITVEQYQELLAKMDELYTLQRLRVEEHLKGEASASQSKERSAASRMGILPTPVASRHSLRHGGPSAHRPPYREGQFAGENGSGPKGSNRPPLLGDRPSRSPMDHAYGLMDPMPRPPAPPSILTSRPLRERRPTPPPPMRAPLQPMPTDVAYMDEPEQSMNVDTAPPEMSEDPFYVPQFDRRWAGKKYRGKENTERTHIVIIDGRSFDMKLNCVQRIRLGTRTFEIGIDSETREVNIGGECYLKLGQPERTVVLSGKKHVLFARGQSKNLWIDSYQYELFMDAPPEKVLINGKEHLLELNSMTNMLVIDGFEVCKVKNAPQKVHIAFEPHEVSYQQPPRNILIDGKMCQLDFSGEFPIVVIEGKVHGIRFDGPPREIWVNNIAFMVDMDKPRRCRLPSETMGMVRPFLLAFGGPGHEVIVEDQWYEVKFNGEEKVITLRDKKISIRLEGPAPEVKILGEVLTPKEMRSITNQNRPELWARNLTGRGMSDGPYSRGPGGRHPAPRNKVPSLLDLDLTPVASGRGTVPRQGDLGAPELGPRMLDRRDQVPFSGSLGSEGMGPGPVGSRGHTLGGSRPFQMGPRPDFDQGCNPDMDGGAGPGIVHGGMQARGLMDSQAEMPLANSQQGGGMPPTNSVDVNDLLSKLISAGIINKTSEKKPSVLEDGQKGGEVAESKADLEQKPQDKKLKALKVKDEEDEDSDAEAVQQVETIPDLTSIDTEELKKVYKGVIQQLFSGVQCPSCGIRFTTEDCDRYREHLDWHFRQNRREKDETKVAKFRRWYYDEADWVQFEEIGDLEERAYSQFFETIMSTSQSGPGQGSQLGADVISCPVAKGDNDDVCDICGEAFEQFYDDDEEEWHLKDAVRAGGKTYHPVCYEDAKETGSVADPETPQVETPMPDPITNPLAYLQVLSDRSKLQAAAAASTSVAASPAAVVDQAPPPSAGVAITPIADTEPARVIKQELAKEGPEQAMPTAPASKQEAALETVATVSVKTELQTADTSKASAAAGETTSNFLQQESSQTSLNQITALGKVKTEPVDTDMAESPRPDEAAPSGCISTEQEALAKADVAAQDEPLTLGSVKEEPVITTSSGQQETVVSGCTGGEPIPGGSAQGGKLSQSSSVLMKPETMDTAEATAGSPAASGVEEGDTSADKKGTVEELAKNSESVQTVTELTQGTDTAGAKSTDS